VTEPSSALSAVPATDDRRVRTVGARLAFYWDLGPGTPPAGQLRLT